MIKYYFVSLESPQEILSFISMEELNIFVQEILLQNPNLEYHAYEALEN
jgi:hypothetical protein